VGQSLPRHEDSALLRGRGAFADDVATKPGTLHACVLRSPHAHAKLLGVDVSAALALPGVRAVLTGEDVQRWSVPFVVAVKQPLAYTPLAIDRVRYVGEPIAVIVATDRYVAEDALELIRVEYAPLPAVGSIEASISDGASLLHEAVGSNVVSERHFSYGDMPTDANLRRITTTVHYPRNSCSPMECGVVLAEYLGADEGYEVLSNFMGPFSLHSVMAMALKVPSNKLRHKVPRDSGGSFGVKQSVFAYVVLMCLASRKAGAPVKWVEDRLEHMSAATSATARLTTLSADVQSDGKILALHWDQADDVGAYLRAPEPATFYRMHGALTGSYDIAHLTARNRVVLTNKTPTGLVRGFGGPQVYFALERLMDVIAQEIGINPFELRVRNWVKADQFPYQAAAGALLDSGNYHALAQAVMQKAHDLGLYEKQVAARAQGRLYGIGISAIVEPSISNMGYITTVLSPEQRAKAGPKNGAVATATVGVDLLGGVNVVIASAPAGQGHMTVCAQVVADVLGVRPQDVMVNVELDTAKDAWSVASGNYSSRFAGAVAGTVHLAACKLRDKIAAIAAAQWQCEMKDIVFAEGQVRQENNAQHAQAFNRMAALAHWAPALLPAGVEPGLRVTAHWSPEVLSAPDEQDRVNTSCAYGFVFDLCALEIDQATGAVLIEHYITGHDAGKILNPALANGQIRGAFAQGIGAALYEEFCYGEDGAFLSGTLADYLMPTTCEVMDPIIIHQETPSPFTPLGAKGLGEGNNMSTPVCVANAFANALQSHTAYLNHQVDVRLPLTPARVLEALRVDDPPSRKASAKKVPSLADIEQASASSASGKPGGMVLKATGDIDIAAAPQQVFDTLLNPESLARVIPGCHALKADGEHSYRAEVTVGVGFIKARYTVQLQLSELNPPHSLRLSGSGESSVGTGAGKGLVRLTAVQDGTRLHYEYQAQVGGKVAMVGSRMLEGASRLIIGQLFESLARQVSQNGSGTQTQIEARNSHDKTWWQACWQKIKRLVKGGAA
jgi:2-furoyl-CoA dehydrogenase large subunit